MPMALPVLGAVFLTVGAVGATVTALGLTAVAFTIAGIGITWAAAATLVGVALLAAGVLMMKSPKPNSTGAQLQTVLDPKSPVPVMYGRTCTGGIFVYRDVSGSKNKYLYQGLALSAGGPIQGVELAYAGDARVLFGGDPHNQVATVNSVIPYAKKVYQSKKFQQRWLRGDKNPQAMSSALPGMPGAPGQASGIAMVLERLEYDTDVFPSGVPEQRWVASGVKCYDPRKDSSYPGGSGSHDITNDSTWEFTENPYLHALDWVLGRWVNPLNRDSKKIYGIGAKWSEVDVASFVAGANVADANNWKSGIVVNTNDDKYAVLTTLLAAGGGVPVARGAQIACFTNQPLTAALTITKEHIVGEVQAANTTSHRDRHNRVVPSYREETQNWEIIQGEVVTAKSGNNEIYVQQDGGQVRTMEIEFTACQQAAQAHQLAVYELCNSREFLTYTLTGKMALLDLRVGDAAYMNVPDVGAVGPNGTPIKVMVTSREFNPMDYSVTLTVKQETDSKHPFALGQSQEPPQPVSMRGFDANDPDAPGAAAWGITATAITDALGNTTPVLVLSGANDNPYTTDIIVEFRVTGTGSWVPFGTYPKDTTQVLIDSVQSQTSYEVAISYKTSTGVISDRLVLAPAVAGTLAIDWTNIQNAPALYQVAGPWQANTAYAAGTIVTWENDSYRVLNNHTSTVPPDQDTTNYEIFLLGGQLPITGYLTNEAHIFPADGNGKISPTYDWTEGGGYFKVMKGDEDVSQQCTFGVVSVTSGLVVEFSSANGKGRYDVSGFLDQVDSATAVLYATYQGITIQQAVSYSKSKNGKLITLSASRQTMAYDTAGFLKDNPTITFTATPTNSTVPLKWYISNGSSFVGSNLPGGTSNGIITIAADGKSATMNPTQFATAAGETNTITVRVDMFDGSYYYDAVSVVKVRDGNKGDTGEAGTSPIVGYLTNEATVIATDSAGNYATGALGAAGGSFKVFWGIADVTASATFNIGSQTGMTMTIGSNGVYSVQSLTADNANATLTATYNGFTVTKLVSVSKSKSGSTLTIISNRQTITLNQAGNLSTPSQDIVLSATKVNTTDTVQWTVRTVGGTVLNPASYLSTMTGDTTTMTAASFMTAAGTEAGVIIRGSIASLNIYDEISVVKVKDGADAKALMVQWATTSTGPWHTNFTTGDLFQRQSVDGGATWTNGIRVVGEDGADGDSGDAAPLIILNVDRLTVPYNGQSPSATAASIAFVVTKQNTTVPIQWSVGNYNNVMKPGNETANYININAQTNSATMTPAQFDALRGGTEGVVVNVMGYDGTGTIFDQQSILRVVQGSGPVTLITNTQSAVSVGVNSGVKVAGAEQWGDANIYSKEGFSNSVNLGFQPAATNKFMAIGIEPTPTASTSYQSLDHCFVFYTNGTWAIMENGNTGPTSGTNFTLNYTTADRFDIVMSNGAVIYRKNGQQVRQTAAISNTAQYYFNAQLYSVGAAFNGVYYGSAAQPGIVGFLTNDAVTLGADSAGTVSSYSGATGNFKVFLGESDISTGFGVAYSVGSAVGVSGQINSTSGAYSITSMTADNGSLNLTAAFAGKFVNKSFVAAKSKTGATGNRTQSVFKNVGKGQARPDTPTGNGIPSGWTDGPTADSTTDTYMSQAQQTSTGVTVGSWTLPIQVSGTNGVDGDDGTNGTDGNFIDVKFQRSVSQPATPNSVPNPSGWSDALPAGTATLWITRARKSYTGAMISGWSTPQKWSNQNQRGEWALNTIYADMDIVTYNGGTYVCTVPHTSTNSNKPTGTAQANTYWDVLAAPGQTGQPGGGLPSFNTSGIAVPGGTGLVNLRALADAQGYQGQDANIVFYMSPTSQTGQRFGTPGVNGARAGTAIDTGTWPQDKNIKLTLRLNGTNGDPSQIRGGGGSGGNGGSYGAGSAGGDGGTGIMMRQHLTIIGGNNTGNPNNDQKQGLISCGGGGGGGSTSDLARGGDGNWKGGYGGGGGFPNGPGGKGGAGVDANGTVVNSADGFPANGTYMGGYGGVGSGAGSDAGRGGGRGNPFDMTNYDGVAGFANGGYNFPDPPYYPDGSVVPPTYYSVPGAPGGKQGLAIQKNGWTLTVIRTDNGQPITVGTVNSNTDGSFQQYYWPFQASGRIADA